MDFFDRYGIKDSSPLCVPDCRTTCKCGPMRMFADGTYKRDFVFQITDHNFGRDLRDRRGLRSQMEISRILSIDIEVYLYLERGRRYTISDDGKRRILDLMEQVMPSKRNFSGIKNRKVYFIAFDNGEFKGFIEFDNLKQGFWIGPKSESFFESLEEARGLLKSLIAKWNEKESSFKIFSANLKTFTDNGVS